MGGTTQQVLDRLGQTIKTRQISSGQQQDKREKDSAHGYSNSYKVKIRGLLVSFLPIESCKVFAFAIARFLVSSRRTSLLIQISDSGNEKIFKSDSHENCVTALSIFLCPAP